MGLGLILPVMVSCTLLDFEEETIYLDPSVGRIALFNDTKNFVIQDTGIFHASVGPGEYIETNIRCYGRVSGMLDAYQVIGKTSIGERVLKWYGQRRYSLYVDGKNTTFRGLDVDAYYVLSDHSFSPGGKREIWITGGLVSCE